ncbi:MAG: chromate resistance protein ChrB domain-containing protein [Pyrinomonadaceae bacterium]
MQNWLLLIHQLPPKPTNLRVRVWRKLQRLGAVVIKNSVYVLPADEKTHEDFQWLKQEIEAAGGEATVFRAGSVAGATDEEIIAIFRQQRDADYARLTAELGGLAGAIREQRRGGHLSASRSARHEAELEKLHAELERSIATDFFAARGRAPAIAAYERCQQALRAALSRAGAAGKASADAGGPLKLAQYQGRRWVTRRNLHIDRLASAWLIKRFIDARPRFVFVTEGETVEGGIPFDMFGAELTHHGEDCTFETMLKQFGLERDAALKELAEIIHDIDLKDNKFNRLEATGLDAVVRGCAALLQDDRKLIRQCSEVFDGLYALLSSRTDQSRTHKDGGKRQTRGRAGQRRKISRSKR